MLVKDFILNSLYKGVNQKLPSYLLGNQGIVNCINYALDDVYTFEGKYWTFMYNNINVDLSNEAPTIKTVTIDIPHPLLRVVRVRDLSKKYTEYNVINLEPFDGVDDIGENEVYFKPHTKTIKLFNNKVGYIIDYIHYFDKIDYESEMPTPDLFEGAIYNLTLGYIYPNYGQMGENKEENVYNKSRQQLSDLAKTDSLQMSGIEGNIH